MRLIFVFFLITFNVSAQFHELLTIKRNQYYQDYLDYIENTLGAPLPTQAVQIAQNKLFTALDQAGFMARMKTGYLLHAGSLSGACRVNMKNPSTYLLTVSSVPFFFEGKGTRSSTSGYLNQPFKSDEYSGIETDLTVIQYVSSWMEYNTIPSTGFSHGMRMNAAGTSVMAQYPKYDASVGYYYHGTSGPSFPNTSSHEGLYVLTYNGTQSVIYRNGTKSTTTNTPIAPNISINRFILSYNNASSSGGTTPLTYYDKFVGADFLFDRFNDADEAAFRAIWTTYVTDVGLGDGFIVDNASHCWFAQPTTAYNASANKSWVGQVHYNPTAARWRAWIFERNHTTGVMTNGFELSTVSEYDDHNEPSILVRASDNRLIAAYTEHAIAGNPLRWRISTNPTDASAWGSENTINPSAGARSYTYASLFQVTNGDIYMFYRGTDLFTGEWYFIKSTDNGSSWGAETQIFNRAYINIYQDPNDKDLLHFIGSPHANETAYASTLVHFYFDAGANTWHKSDGTGLSLPVTTSTGTAIYSKTNPERVWFEDLTVDGNGYPRASMLYYPDITSTPELKHRVYTEWNGSSWSTPHDFGQVMNKNIGTVTLVETYAGGSHFDPANPDILFVSNEVAGRMEIFKLNRLSSSSFGSTQITFNSTYDQWRPLVSSAPTYNTFWLGKVFYIDYKLPGAYYQVLVNKTLK